MSIPRMLAALTLVLLTYPTIASAAIVQKWKTPNGSTYLWVPEASADLDGNGSYEMVTVEPQSGGVIKIAIRSGSTGALLAQTSGTYGDPRNFVLANLDNAGSIEILFTDRTTGNLNCLSYTAPGTLASRFSFKPTSLGVPSEWEFADLDGTGQWSMVFKDEAPLSNNYYVRDNVGTLVATITPTAPPSGAGWSRHLAVDDYDADGRQELLIDYHAVSPSQDVLYVFESNAPAPSKPLSIRTPIVPPAARADGRPAALAARPRFGPASHRVDPEITGESR